MPDNTVPAIHAQEHATAGRTAAREGFQFAFRVWLAMRVLFSVWGAIVLFAGSFGYRQKLPAQYPDVALPGNDLYGYTIGVWNIYDTPHFVTIADKGYSPDPGFLTIFFPGYPFLTKVASVPLLGDSLLAALVVANLSALIFFWYLYRLVEPDYGQAVARRAVIFAAIFPTSFFLFLGYTEAPLLAFTVSAFYYGRQQKWWAAGLLAGAAALMKQPGVFLVLPLGYMYLRQYMAHKLEWPVSRKLSWAWLLLAPAAALGYTVYRYLFSGTKLTDVTDLGAHEILTLPGIPLVQSILMLRPDNPLLALNVIDLAFTLLMIGLTAGVALKIRSIEYTLYSVILAVVSLSVTWTDITRPEVNMPRRLIIIFPIFLYLAMGTDGPRRFRWFVIASLLSFMVLSALFINWTFIS